MRTRRAQPKALETSKSDGARILGLCARPLRRDAENQQPRTITLPLRMPPTNPPPDGNWKTLAQLGRDSSAAPAWSRHWKVHRSDTACRPRGTAQTMPATTDWGWTVQ